MAEASSDPVEVLGGRHGDLQWQVWAGGSATDLMTMLHVFDAGLRVAASGFGGPALYPGQQVSEWRGRTDDLPYFVMARTAPQVTRLVAVTDRGTHVELTLGEVDPRFGLRFAAAGLPDGEAPGVLLLEVAGAPAGSIPQTMSHPFRRPGGPNGPTSDGNLADRGCPIAMVSGAVLERHFRQQQGEPAGLCGAWFACDASQVITGAPDGPRPPLPFYPADGLSDVRHDAGLPDQLPPKRWRKPLSQVVWRSASRSPHTSALIWSLVPMPARWPETSVALEDCRQESRGPCAASLARPGHPSVSGTTFGPSVEIDATWLASHQQVSSRATRVGRDVAGSSAVGRYPCRAITTCASTSAGTDRRSSPV